ncbi:MAG: AMP-binding protein [Actinomycetaceae bacterium]|nr:AMP-binding protein [Actinomycetaceae bacterium]
MKDTATAPVPVRFRFITGGTAPADVVSLIEALEPLVEAELDKTRALWPDGIFGNSNKKIAEGDDAHTVAPPPTPSSQTSSEDSPEDAQDSQDRQDSEDAALGNEANNENLEVPAPPAPPTPPAPPAPTFKEVLVPTAPGVDPADARATLISRISGHLPARTQIVMQTSGSSIQDGHLVALSMSAIVASAQASSAFLGRPGRWILALPTQHIAGLQVLVRALIAGIPPLIVDTTRGFQPKALARAIDRAKAKDTDTPAYLSLVPTQLSECLDAGQECVEALKQLDAVLLGGSAATPYLLDRARAHGIKIVTTYGMTETCGGCVYDGIPLPGVHVACVAGIVWLSGTILMEGYLEAQGDNEDSPFVDMSRRRWLRTKDTGRMDGPRLIVQGRADDVINTGGVKVHASAVESAAGAVEGVGEVCVVGLPDSRWIEVVTAVVVASGDFEGDLVAPMYGAVEGVPAAEGIDEGGLVEPDSLAARIRTAVTAELGGAHAPRIIAIVPDLPKLGPGKIDRREVLALAQRELRAGRAWVR